MKKKLKKRRYAENEERKNEVKKETRDKEIINK